MPDLGWNLPSHLSQLRLLLEELCCDLCRFEHVAQDGLDPSSIRIDREYWLGAPGAFADIRVVPGTRAPYFVEIKYGYSRETLLSHLRRKYSRRPRGIEGESKVILIIDAANCPDSRLKWPSA
jgi:hypothetical protein